MVKNGDVFSGEKLFCIVLLVYSLAGTNEFLVDNAFVIKKLGCLCQDTDG